VTVPTFIASSLPAIGQSPVRLEDERLLRGLGRFVGALQVSGLAHAVVVRSPYARARLGEVDVSRARAMPGVAAAFTADDLVAAGIQPLGFHAAVGGENGGEMSAPRVSSSPGRNCATSGSRSRWWWPRAAVPRSTRPRR
jgi:CO/xanthine dehydrogenase Mo-binding subunit